MRVMQGKAKNKACGKDIHGEDVDDGQGDKSKQGQSQEGCFKAFPKKESLRHEGVSVRILTGYTPQVSEQET